MVGAKESTEPNDEAKKMTEEEPPKDPEKAIEEVSDKSKTLEIATNSTELTAPTAEEEDKARQEEVQKAKEEVEDKRKKLDGEHTCH